MVLTEQSTQSANVVLVLYSIQVIFQLRNSKTQMCVSQQNK